MLLVDENGLSMFPPQAFFISSRIKNFFINLKIPYNNIKFIKAVIQMISTTKKKPSPINRLEPDSTAVGIATNRIVQLIDANTKEMKKDQIEPYKTFRGEKRKT